MPLFSYIIRDKFKKVLKGSTEADSEEALRKRFRGQGYLVFSIRKANEANASEKDKNLFEDFKFSKLLFIFILIGGSYLVIKSINRFSYKFKEKKGLVKVETLLKEAPVIEIPRIITEEIIYEPEQNIVIDKVVPKPEPEQKEGIIKITLKSEVGKILANKKALSNYANAQKYYDKASKHPANPKIKNPYLRKAIKYAQQALQAKEGVEEEILAFIRDCRKKLRE